MKFLLKINNKGVLIIMIDNLLYKDEVLEIIGAAIEVHKEIGSGFLESVYEDAMSIESGERNIPYKRQVHFPIYYKGNLLKKEFIADFISIDKIIVEFKSIPKITGIEEAQIINYLKATGLKLGLIINFGSTSKLEWKRYIK